MPDIKVDFSRVTYSGILEVLAPVIPGGILAIGTLVMDRPFTERVLSNPYLGYKTRIAVACFMAYVAGLLLNLIVGYTSYAIGYTFGYVFAGKISKVPPEPWRNVHWRRLARKFIGNELAPRTDDLYLPQVEFEQWKDANEIADPTIRAAQLKWVHDYHFERQIADNDWYYWFQTLAAYFSKPTWHAPPAQYFLSILHSSSWAVILLMGINHQHHWLVWLFCSLGLLFGNAGIWFTGGSYSADAYGINQTAQILKEIRSSPQGKDTAAGVGRETGASG